MPKRYISKKIRQEVKERAVFCCEYCQIPENFCPEDFAIDHITPISQDGSNELDNLAAACHGCNWCKTDKTEGIDPLTSEKVKLFNPRKQDWKEHFEWHKSNLEIQGLTPTGRATVEVMQLNRPSLINMRYALSVIRKHPPPHTVKE